MLGTFDNESPILDQVPMHFDQEPTVASIRRRLNQFVRRSTTEQLQRLRVTVPRSQQPTQPIIDNAKPGIQFISEPCMRSHPFYQAMANDPLVDYTQSNMLGRTRYMRKRHQYPVYDLSSVVDEVSPTATFNRGTGVGVDRFGDVPFIRTQDRRVRITESPQNLQFVPRTGLPSVSPLIGKRTAIRYR